MDSKMGATPGLRQRDAAGRVQAVDETASGAGPAIMAWGEAADLKASVAGRPIAAFDFDGTITVRDSFMGFLRWRAGPVRYAAGLLRLTPDMAAYLGHRDRGRLKAAAVRVFLKGLTRESLRAECAAYADAAWDGLIRPDALETWNAWRDRGAALVVVTASPEDVVAPFAARLGADALIGTRLAFDADDRVAGAFDGENCRGPQKVARLRQALGEDVRLAAAYGDTSGDTEMLAIADEPGFRVFTATPSASSSVEGSKS